MKNNKLKDIKLDFITKWGVIGTAWGINRTMGQTFMLLSLTPDELSTDEIMAELKISRGNANTTLRELVNWGIVKKNIPLGGRKEFFSAERNQWRLFCRVIEARRSREILPAIDLLKEAVSDLEGLKSSDSQFVKNSLKQILKFFILTNRILQKVETLEENKFLSWVSKFVK